MGVDMENINCGVLALPLAVILWGFIGLVALSIIGYIGEVWFDLW